MAMNTYAIDAEMMTAGGEPVIAPDGCTVEIHRDFIAASVHTAVNRAVSVMSTRFDKTYQRHYSAPPRMGVGDKIVVQVRRIN